MCPEHPGARAGRAGMGKERQTPARTQVSPHAAVERSHGVVENDVLLGQLQQHGVIEELADAHVLTQALPAPGLDHELSGQMWGWLGLQGSDDDALVQGVTRHNLPVVEDRE